MAKKKTNWLLIILVLLILAMVAIAFFKRGSKPKGTVVKTEQVAKRTIYETVSASGKIFPEVEVKISSDVSGEIVNLYVAEGDSVVQGQLLAKIDPEAIISQVERQQAMLNNAKANLAGMEASMETNKAQIEQNKAQLSNAKKIHQRNTELLGKGVISQQEFDQSEANMKQFEANLKSAEASLRAAMKNKEAASYSVKSSEATLREMRTNLGRTSIKAPTSGIVSSLSVEKGERVVGTIQMTGTEMMRISNLNTMEVQVDVSENDILRVQLGDKADVEVDAYMDRVFKGTVTEIANSASNLASAASLNTEQVTNFIVKIRIDSESFKEVVTSNNKYPFRPGMSASVDIFTQSEEGVLSVPIQAVTVREKDEDSKKKRSEIEEDDLMEVVFVVKNDTVAMVPVSTGIQDDEFIKVESGLEEDDEVVIGPYSAVSKMLEEGKTVTVKNDKDKDEDED